MTFASRRDVVVLFGGDVGGSVVGDTWEWDGSHWRQAADFGPKPCRGAAMTSAAGATVLFGGLEPTGQPPRLSHVTWQWDGQRWVARQDMGPSGRWGHAIAFDEERGRIVLFGGLSVAPDAVDAAHGVLGDTWETSPPPPPANLTTFADARQGREWTLLVGDDRLLHAGLQAGWDGSVSGVAGCCPDLLVALVRSAGDGRATETARLQALLDELIGRLSVFPTPWGIRIALEARGFATGPLPLPLIPGRRQQILEFQEWFRGWIARRPGS